MGKNRHGFLGPHGFLPEIHMVAVYFYLFFALFLLFFFFNTWNSIFITCVFSPCRFCADLVDPQGSLIIPTLRPEYVNGLF